MMFTPVGFFNSPSPRHRTSSRYRPKPLSQRNLLSAFFGLTSVVFLATAIVEPRWFYVKGGTTCSGHFLGIYKMLSLKSSSVLKKACYSADTILKLKITMGFLCCGAVFSFFSCLLDIWGPNKRIFQMFRSNSIGNIITVVMSVGSCAFAYWITVSIKKHISPNINKSVHVHVTFSYSFYLVVAGGTCALLACAFNMINCNCRRNGEQFSSEEELTAELMNSMDAALPSTIRGEPPPVYSV